VDSPKKFEQPKVHKTVEHKPVYSNIPANLKNSMLTDDYQIDKAIYKKLDISLPVKVKTIDYFKLVDNIKKTLDHGVRELQSNKIEKTLDHAMLALYYLHNIKK
jgi:hypothetical protein